MNGLWAGELEEQVVLASFAPEPEARRALDRVGASAAVPLCLLPVLYRRWPSVETPCTRLGREAYLTAWRQNRQRLPALAVVLDRFERAGIRCLVLKGAALVLRYYKDAGARNMHDLDLLVPETDIEAAVAELQAAGQQPCGGASSRTILRRAAVGHSWQFTGEDASCDLHWRPVARCHSPEVVGLFWDGAERVALRDRTALVPGPTDQLFHVCASALQRDWNPQVRWVADALTVMREPIEWERLRRLAAAAFMNARLGHALRYLRHRFGAPVPARLPGLLDEAAEPWERREHRRLLIPSRFPMRDAAASHACNLRCLRRADARWRSTPAWSAFPRYLAAFLDARGAADLGAKLWDRTRDLLVRRA